MTNFRRFFVTFNFLDKTTIFLETESSMILLGEISINIKNEGQSATNYNFQYDIRINSIFLVIIILFYNECTRMYLHRISIY